MAFRKGADMSVNKVMLIGNVGRDPEIRRTNSGDTVASFSVATSETWRDKASGERKERVEWHNVVIFNEQLAKVAEQYVKKGSRVYVEGALQTRKFTDKNGVERSVSEVVLQKYRGEIQMIGRREDPDVQADEDETMQRRERPNGLPQKPHKVSEADLRDEIPF